MESIALSFPHRHGPLQMKKPSQGIPIRVSATLDNDVPLTRETKTSFKGAEGPKERIKKMLNKVELSVSAYDTAWVAMVPSPNSPNTPLFPGCVEWVLENQLHDGSWGFPRRDLFLTKDALSSTLACVLALKRWDMGEWHVKKGLHFIESNFSSINDQKQQSPIGFDIIFPGMVECARHMDLVLPLSPSDINSIFSLRDLELERCHRSNSDGTKAYLASLSEGMGKLNDWKSVMSYQRKNGSLFNSPSTTAAALTHTQDANCLNYLQMLLDNFVDGVPTIYPLDVRARLSMVDNLEKLGIDRHFKQEIRRILDETYRWWLQKDEEISSDLTTCALAFRLLRTNGYDVSSDLLTHFAEEDQYLHSLEGQYDETSAVLELFMASQLAIYPSDSVLERQNSWSQEFLQRKLHNGSIRDDNLRKQVIIALNFPYHSSLDRIVNKAYLEQYDPKYVKMAKTSYCCSNISNEDFHNLGLIDFNMCQLQHQQEIKQFETWETKCRFARLKFSRQWLGYCYVSAAAKFFSPELSDTRISWVKHALLTFVVDDFFDVGSSKEEQENLIALFEKWDIEDTTKFCSEAVEILFLALHSTISETADMAFKLQGRCVKDQLIETWLDVLKSMRRETIWVSNKTVPTIDEYLKTGLVSIAVAPVLLPVLYLAGPKLSKEVVPSWEYDELFKLISTCGRLLNDVQSYEREAKQGKLNAVHLHMIHNENIITEEDSVKALKEIIDENRKKLLRLTLESKGNVVPRACKDLFWDMSQILHFIFSVHGFSSPKEMISAMNEVIYKPFELPELKMCEDEDQFK
ncbi:Terpene synthase, metal-binding domain [Dillenia turbinata]|uniref:Terpene synthase, metal-binding domain n=1 Tax=Dillenia turbinata TaxID=194707 RepID=A0AAN8ZHA2_9MAGN